MDTSEQYIKMCEKAEEIQKGHPQDGVGGHWHSGCIILTHEGDYYRVIDKEAERTCESCGNTETYILSTRSIFLPRQDQLQEMVVNDWADNFRKFIHWCFPSIGKVIPFVGSMEQLWLAFVMKEKYNKTWDGENWAGG